MKILVTGGTGFIGSHASTILAEAGHDLVIIDNLSNSRADVVDRLKALTDIGTSRSARVTFATELCSSAS